MIVLTAVGLCLAGYLTYVHYSGVTPPCSIKGNPCSQVQKSQYSLLIGIPVALIGLLGYIAILGSLFAPDGERARLVTMALILGGFGFSLYLTYRELLHAAQNLRVVRIQCRDHDRARVPGGMALLARGGESLHGHDLTLG